LRTPAPSHPPARAAGGIEVKRSQGRRAVLISQRSTPRRLDAGSAVRKQSAVTNRDKQDNVRRRMADAGEPFNVARRKVEAAAAGHISKAELLQIERTGSCDLSNRELTALPAEIARLTNLRELRLDGNRLTALPPEIARLTNLAALTLDDNRLTVLPAEIARLTGLRRLGLEGNRLTALPPEIGQLTGLRVLRLDGNGLTALPREVADLLSGGLELVLAGNPLQGPIFELYGQGAQALASYLHSLE
jgi:Leucine-rich repeat (LRR) protein